MKLIYNRFACDQCGKEGVLFLEGTKKYPYEDGWVYLYNFKFKIDNYREKGVNDKHFCCSGCMSNYVDKILLEIKNE